jgi:hypothetical protein
VNLVLPRFSLLFIETESLSLYAVPLDNFSLNRPLGQSGGHFREGNLFKVGILELSFTTPNPDNSHPAFIKAVKA